MIKGKTILVTRPKGQAESFARTLKSRGAKVLVIPTIKIVPPKNLAPLDRAISTLKAYDWIIFASANAVRCFMERFRKGQNTMKDLQNIKTCAIGPATAASMRALKMPVTKISDDYVAESILKIFPRPKGLRILIPRAKEGRDILQDVLRKRGARVKAVTAYETVLDDSGKKHLLSAIKNNKIDCASFTSSSTVNGFFSMLKAHTYKIIHHKNFVAASIGPVTTETLLKHGWNPKIIAQKPLTPLLAQAIIKYYSKGRP